jgi:hypothetical protein
VIEKFPGTCTNIIFLRVGLINSKNFRGSKEMEQFKESVISDGQKYIRYANELGYYARISGQSGLILYLKSTG